MSKPRILIVGGVAGGASAAARARRMNESADIVIFEKGEYVSFANCGLPYHIGGDIADRQKLLVTTPERLRKVFNIDVRTRHEVLKIDRPNKRVEVLNHTDGTRAWEPYDKLILAPGASPIVPQWQAGAGQGVFTLRDLSDMDRIKAHVDSTETQRAVVVGAGFIGLEMVEVLARRGLQVDLVELQPQVLPLLDREMAAEIEANLADHDVKLHLGTSMEDVTRTDGCVQGVRLANGRELAADLVVMSIGVRPNSKLASEAGLAVGPRGGIAVNEWMQTSDPAIYAVGDAAEVVHQVLSAPMVVPLAGPANRNGRLAGQHAATGSARLASPVAGTAIVGVFGQTAAMTGLSARAACRAGLPCAVAYAIENHHAGYYPGAEPMILKLVYDPHTGRVLGAQAVGGAGVDKRIDVIATAIHFSGTIDDLAGLDLAYAPQFGSARDPVHVVAFIAQNERDQLVRHIAPGEAPVDGQLVDVRNDDEVAQGTLPGAVHIPLPAFRESLSRLKKDQPVTVFCQKGLRGYVAARILMQHGFKDVWNLAGGYRMHRRTWGRKQENTQ